MKATYEANSTTNSSKVIKYVSSVLATIGKKLIKKLNFLNFQNDVKGSKF